MRFTEEHEPLVTILETENEAEALIVAGLLESCDIPALLTTPGAGGHHVHGAHRRAIIRVLEGDADAALRTIAEYRAAVLDEDIEPE